MIEIAPNHDGCREKLHAIYGTTRVEALKRGKGWKRDQSVTPLYHYAPLFCHYCPIFEGRLGVKLPTIWTDEQAEQKVRRESPNKRK